MAFGQLIHVYSLFWIHLIDLIANKSLEIFPALLKCLGAVRIDARRQIGLRACYTQECLAVFLDQLTGLGVIDHVIRRTRDALRLRRVGPQGTEWSNRSHLFRGLLSDCR